jgi:hypothetical protein
MTSREFTQIIKGKKTGQLKAKLALGTMLLKDLQENSQEDPRTPQAIQSMEQQTAIIKRELKRRARQLDDNEAAEVEEVKQEIEKEAAESGPKDQVIGVQTLSIKGKASIN